jgi:hypothetical protein
MAVPKRHALYYETDTTLVSTRRLLVAVTTEPSPVWLRLRRYVHVLFFGWS